jgi:hypothetical protein
MITDKEILKSGIIVYSSTEETVYHNSLTFLQRYDNNKDNAINFNEFVKLIDLVSYDLDVLQTDLLLKYKKEIATSLLKTENEYNEYVDHDSTMSL